MIRSIVLVMLAALCSSTAFAQNRCHTLNDNPLGVCVDSGCESLCPVSSPPIESRLMAGFFTQQTDGKIIVTGVLPNSPAAIAGVEVGDHLLRVDNFALPFDGGAPDWQDGQWHMIELRRGSLFLRKQIKMKSVQTIVSQLPVLSDPIKNASFPPAQVSFIAAPFISGMLVHNDGSQFVVDTILQGSPAESAGIRPGDHLMKGEGDAASLLEYSNERRTLRLSLRGYDRGKEVTVRFASLSELLDGAAMR